MKASKILISIGLIFTAITFSLVSGSCNSPATSSVVQFSSENETVIDSDGLEQVIAIQEVFRDIASSVMPAVVDVYAESEVQSYSPYEYEADPYFKWFFGDDFFDDYYGGGGSRSMEVQGSGFIFSEDGYIFSNHHVVDGATKIKVTLEDGRVFSAELIGADVDTDIAVLKIEDEEPLPYVSIGDSDEVQIGDMVIAMGNPFGLGGSFTFGVVSAVEREGMAQYQSFIQTDTAVNPGNSGGPLLNIYGQVIGINTAIQTQSGGFEGISFAVPINIAKNVALQLIETGTVQRGLLGIYPSEIDDATRDALGLAYNEGVMVSMVTPDSAAEIAGIERGDIVLKVNDKSVSTPTELRVMIANMLPGSEVEIELKRYTDDTTVTNLTVTAVLQSRDGDIVTGSSSDDSDSSGGSSKSGTYEFLGVTFMNAPDDVLKENNESDGVMVFDVSSDSELYYVLEYGDLVIGINRTPIKNIADLKAFVEENKNKKAFTFQIVSDGYMYYRGVQIDD